MTKTEIRAFMCAEDDMKNLMTKSFEQNIAADICRDAMSYASQIIFFVALFIVVVGQSPPLAAR